MGIIVKGTDMSVSAAAREGRRRSSYVAMEDCIARWARLNPDAVLALQQQVRNERQNLRRSNGMSPDGFTMKKGQIPVKLHRMLQKEVDSNWLWDPVLRNRFWRIFKIGCVNPKSEMTR